MAEYQLRIYQVAEGEMDAFLDAFSQVVSARKAHGFSIVGAWKNDAENRFVWIVGYDGPGGFEAAATRYYASPEKAAMSPDPGSFLTSVQTSMMTAVAL